MSNRSYLIGLFIGLATFAIGCLLLFGNFFAHANHNQPAMPPSEMNAIESNYQYLSNHKDKKAIPKIINNYYENQFKAPNKSNYSSNNRGKSNEGPMNQTNNGNQHSKGSSG